MEKLRIPSRPACTSFLKNNLLPILTISGVIGGVILGVILRNTRDEPWSKREVMYVGYPGEIFLRSLKALILPLVVSSIISAIGTLDLSLSKKIGLRAVGYYVTTTLLAVILGIVLVLSIRPGVGGASHFDEKESFIQSPTTTPDRLLDLVRNIFPPNIIQACFQNYYTILTEPKNYNSSKNISLYEYDISGSYRNGMNIMGLICFATTLGVALSVMGDKGKPLLDLFTAISEASMIITRWLIWVSPIGIMFLIASMMIEMEDFSLMLGQIGWYIFTVITGVLIHGFIVLSSLYMIFIRQLPFRFYTNMSQAYITAFATASSSATLPVTLECLEDKNRIDSRVTRFIIPIGATINMDGTALYEAVSVIFISQVRGHDLGIGQVIAISITATAAAIGAAGIPQAGLVTMIMVLEVVGLPAQDVVLVIAVDWLLDRFRTMINVLGDSVGAALVYHFSKAELQLIDTVNGDVEYVNGKHDKTNGEIALLPSEGIALNTVESS